MGGNSLTMAWHGRQFPYNASTWEAIPIQSPPVQFRWWGGGGGGGVVSDLKVHTPTAFLIGSKHNVAGSMKPAADWHK